MSDEKIASRFVMGDGLQQGDPANTVDLTTWQYNPTLGNTAGAGTYVGNLQWVAPPPSPYPVPACISTEASLTEDRVREIVETAVQQALYPGGTISTHEHRRVEMIEESGKRWRGMLYPVDEHATDPMVPVAKGQEQG
jgi:hypothetical protein